MMGDYNSSRHQQRIALRILDAPRSMRKKSKKVTRWRSSVVRQEKEKLSLGVIKGQYVTNRERGGSLDVLVQCIHCPFSLSFISRRRVGSKGPTGWVRVGCTLLDGDPSPTTTPTGCGTCPHILRLLNTRVSKLFTK